MKHFYSGRIMLLATVLLLLSNTLVKAQIFTKGDGTSDSPWEIHTVDELVALSLTSEPEIFWVQKHFKLMADLDMKDVKAFHPIGYSTAGAVDYHFKECTFDGNNHVISNLTVTPHDDHGGVASGFFGFVKSSHIKNLGLDHITVDAKATQERVGALAGQLQGHSLSNCFVTNGIVTGKGRVGALVGYLQSRVDNCFADVAVDGNWGVGGLFGHSDAWCVVGQCVFYGTAPNGNPLFLNGKFPDAANLSDLYLISTHGAKNPLQVEATVLDPVDMTQQTNFPGLAFNENGLWTMNPSSYPVLKMFPSSYFEYLPTYVALPITVTTDGVTPLENASIEIDGVTYSTNANGQYTGKVPGGSFSYKVTHAEYTDPIIGSIVLNDQTSEVTLNFTGEAAVTYNVSFTVSADYGTGVVLENVEIALFQMIDGSPVAVGTYMTDASGVVTVNELLAGSYRYNVTKENFFTQNDLEFSIVDQNVSKDVVLVLDNQKPVAHAGDGGVFQTGDEISLNASFSSDPDGHDLTYKWSCDDSDIQLIGADSKVLFFTAPTVQEKKEYTLTLVVNDGYVDSEPATTVVMVQTNVNVGETNLLVNGDFEAASLEAWTGTGLATASDITKDSESAQSLLLEGDNSFKFTTSDATVFDLTIGKTYVLEGDIYAETMDLTVLNFRIMNKGGWNDNAKCGVVKPDNTWGDCKAVLGQWVHFRKVIPIGVTYLKGSVEGDKITSVLDVSSSDGMLGTKIYLDNLSLREYGAEKVDAPLALTATPSVTVEEVKTVTLSATCNYADVATIEWTTTDGDVAWLDDASSLTPSFTAPEVEQTTVYTYTVTARKGNEEVSANVEISVNPAPDALTISAVSSVVVETLHSVTLSADCNYDSNVQIAWTTTDGDVAWLDDPSSLTPSFTAPEVDQVTVYTYKVTATMGDEVVSAYVEITVNLVPESLTITAVSPVVVETLQPVSLSADCNYDSNVQIAWTTTDGDVAWLDDASSLTPSFTAPEVDQTTVYTYKVTAVMGEEEVSASVEITVKPAPDALTITAVSPVVVEALQSVSLSADCNYDSNLEIAWTTTDGDVAWLDNAASLTPSFTAPAVDQTTVYTYTVTVTMGDEVVSVDVEITVNPVPTDADFMTVETLKIYPNPIVGPVTVEVKEQGDLTICNILGEVVIRKQCIAGENRFDFSNLSSGLYLFKYSSKSGLAIEKVIKR